MVNQNSDRWIGPMVLLLCVCGCDSPDDRLLELSRKSLDRQAAQSEMLAQQGQTINESAQKLVEQTHAAGLKLVSDFGFGHDYAETLKQWGQRFEAAWKEGRIKGFDAQFRKLWLFYLAYCEAGFRTERTNVLQLQLQRAD